MTLELGGKSPQIVVADAELERTADAILTSILANGGQGCVAGTTVIVEISVADALTRAVAARMAAARPGLTRDEASTYSPIISDRQLRRIDEVVPAAADAGAEYVIGGAAIPGPGYFYQPTILAKPGSTSPASAEEIFGSVLTVQTFETEEQAMALADHPTSGLAAGLFTTSLSRALRLIRRIEAGTVWVNR